MIQGDEEGEDESVEVMESDHDGSYEHVQAPSPHDVNLHSSPLHTSPLHKSILKRSVVEQSGKSVSFRNVLADYVEPVPVNIINEEEYANVLESYKELCDKLRVRPCQKLVDQLEGLQDSTLKLDTIDLKGARLDAAHCEALEAVLRVLRAQTLNIEQTQLDDDGAISVFEMIEYYEPVTRLIVANNVRLGVRAWLALARLLKRFHRLEYLDVRRTSLDESTMPLLCRVLKLNCTLRVLHLEDNHLSGILTRNLVWGLRTNTLLQDLYLGHNKLTPEDAKLLGSLLITNRTIRLLDLRNNRLQDTGILFLSSALEEQHAGLLLITVWSNQITSNSMSALGRALAFHTTLEGVNLGSNALGNKGVECLKEGLLSSRSIARLVMASCNITNEGAVVMAEIIGDHTTLIHLDLRENNISLAGVMALKCAYAINHNLLRLHLDAMKRSNNEELMTELLQEIEQFSVRNLENHKNNSIYKNNASKHTTCDQIPEEEAARSLQEQADYQLAVQLQQEESRAHTTVTRGERPLPIISPAPAGSPPDKSFGFFSGHYIKLKQRWDESVGMYLNKGDVSLAASPGTTEFYNKSSNTRYTGSSQEYTGTSSSQEYTGSPNSTDEEDENFVDAVEAQETNGLAAILQSLDGQERTISNHVVNSEDVIYPEDRDVISPEDGDHITRVMFNDFDEVWFGGSESSSDISSPSDRGSSGDTDNSTPSYTSSSTDYTHSTFSSSDLSHDTVTSDDTVTSHDTVTSLDTDFTRSSSESTEIENVVA